MLLKSKLTLAVFIANFSSDKHTMNILRRKMLTTNGFVYTVDFSSTQCLIGSSTITKMFCCKILLFSLDRKSVSFTVRHPA